MKSIFLALAALLALAVIGSAQAGGASRQGPPTPVSTPEPITVIALTAGALAAGGFALRRSKDKK
jgi:hypothetical protein